MRYLHLRNATGVLSLGARQLLIDPMLSAPGALMPFRFGKGRRRNPLVPLPANADGALAEVTDVIVTHAHPDHLDRAAIRWIRSRGLPVWCALRDVDLLQRWGLDARPLRTGALDLVVDEIPTAHGWGLVGWAMGAGSGFVLRDPAEGTVYLTSDTRFTGDVEAAIVRWRPDLTIAPAGAANFGLGPDILFSPAELELLVRVCRDHDGELLLNHVEALDHCPTRRDALRARIDALNSTGTVHVPSDGDQIQVRGRPPRTSPRSLDAVTRGGLRKMVTEGAARWLLG